MSCHYSLKIIQEFGRIQYESVYYILGSFFSIPQESQNVTFELCDSYKNGWTKGLPEVKLLHSFIRIYSREI